MRNEAHLLAFFLAACGSSPSPPPSVVEIPSASPPSPTPPPSRPAEPRTVHVAPPPPQPTEGDPAPASCDVASAEKTFEEGRRAAASGDYHLARTRFAESYACDPAMGTLLNLANVEEQIGDRKNAIRHFEEAAIVAAKRGDTARAQFAKQRADALRNRP